MFGVMLAVKEDMSTPSQQYNKGLVHQLPSGAYSRLIRDYTKARKSKERSFVRWRTWWRTSEPELPNVVSLGGDMVADQPQGAVARSSAAIMHITCHVPSAAVIRGTMLEVTGIALCFVTLHMCLQPQGVTALEGRSWQ